MLEVNEAGVTGWVAPAGDVAAWRRVLAEVMADPAEARVRGEAGRRRVQESFQRDRLARDLGAWYEELRLGRGQRLNGRG